MRKTLLLLSLLLLTGPLVAQTNPVSDARLDPLPAMRWGHMQNHALWNRAAYRALQDHGAALPSIVPRDIENWCPHYPQADLSTRRLFWVGFLSALAKHESTYKPQAVGGGGRWFGLVQIAPATARGYGCRAGTGEALKTGADNLSCAIRIMSTTVTRDGVIHGRDSRWRGVSADWGPMRSQTKRADMAGWLRAQPFCQAPVAPAPVAPANSVHRQPRSSSDR